MKYKRQLMSTMFALSLFAISPSVFAAPDFVPNSKVSQYEGQMHMRSFNKTTDEATNKKVTKKHKRFQKVYNQR